MSDIQPDNIQPDNIQSDNIQSDNIQPDNIQSDNITNEEDLSGVGQPDVIEEQATSDTKQSNENHVPQLDKSKEVESEFLVFEKSCKDIKYLKDLDKNFIDNATTSIDRATAIIEGCERYDRGQMLTGIDDLWIKQKKLSYGANASVFDLGNENVLRLTYYSREKINYYRDMKPDEKKKYIMNFWKRNIEDFLFKEF